MRRDFVFLVMLTAFAATAVPQMASAQATTPFRQLGRAAIFRSTIDPPMNPAIVIATIVAREVAIWFGAAISSRGRRVKARNIEAAAEYKRETAEKKAEFERSQFGSVS